MFSAPFSVLDVFACSRYLTILFRLFQHKKALAATANALLLHKCLKQRMWDNSNQECRQLPGIGRLFSERLTAAGLGRLRDLETADARVIESVAQRHYPFGTHSQVPHKDAQFLFKLPPRKVSFSPTRVHFLLP